MLRFGLRGRLGWVKLMAELEKTGRRTTKSCDSAEGLGFVPLKAVFILTSWGQIRNLYPALT